MVTNLSALSGPQFLWLYGALIVAALTLGGWLAKVARPEGQPHSLSDPLELAFLSSGAGRFAEAALARLAAEGALDFAPKNKLRVEIPGHGASAAERSLTDQSREFRLGQAVTRLRPHARVLESQLVERGLLIEKARRPGLRLLPCVPLVLVLALGWYRYEAGVALGRPVGFLAMMMWVAGILLVVRLLWFDRRTRAGQEAVAEAKRHFVRLKSAPTNDEMGLGVALFGSAILAGTPYAPLYAMRQSGGGDAAYIGSSDGGGGCGGGGCGGGCGGCGG